MIARIAVFALLAVSVSAVNLQHAVPKLSAQGMSQNPFAAAVLAELNEHLEAGGPADELLKIIEDIRTRVNEATDADAAGWAARKAQCEAQKIRLDGLIQAKEKEISDNEQEQDNARDQMDIYKREWDRLEGEMVAKQAQIDAKKAEIEELDAKRAYEQEVFENRTRDTQECLTAIQDILALEGHDLLADSQGDNADAVKAAYTYERKSTDIGTVAPSDAALVALQSKLHSESAKAIMEEAMDNKGDYDRLKSLLETLETELGKYEQELQTAETEAIAIYTSTRAAAVKVLEDFINQLKDLTAQRDSAKASYEYWEGVLAELEQEHARLTQELADLNTELDNWVNTCTLQEQEYNQRVIDRNAEQDTLDAIETLIRDKLGHLMDGAKSTKTQDDVENRLVNGRADE